MIKELQTTLLVASQSKKLEIINQLVNIEKIKYVA